MDGMANLPALVVLTLLQLCRAEISDTLPETWYSANVINHDFQPKSIQDIFTTEPTFSSTNPIIVLPKSSKSNERVFFSSPAPPLQAGSGSSTFTDFSNVTPLSQAQSTSPPISPTGPIMQTHRTTIVHAVETSSPSTPLVSAEQRTTQEPQLRASQSQLQQIRFEVVPVGQVQPETVTSGPQTNIPVQTNSPQLSATRDPQNNYFLIYQHAPQSIQSYAPPVPVAGPELPTISTASPSTATPFLISSTESTISSTSVSTISSTLPPISSSTFPQTTVRTVSIPASTLTWPTSRVTNTPTRNTLCPNPRQTVSPVTTPIPNLSITGVPYPLRIRVVAPTGSITNVNINPATTKTTTTRRPTTTRAKRVTKPKRNSYDRCINSCKGNKDPICTVPLGSTPIDPNTLKGFPSVCHMACHNSYKKDAYEKVLDGRCGRLRTRIQSVGSKNKLTRDELNKAQYTIESTGPHTFIEFAGARR